MVCDKFRLGPGNAGKFIFQGPGNRGMDVLPVAFQDRAIDGVTDHGMPENIDGVRGAASFINQARTHQIVYVSLEAARLKLGHLLKQAVGNSTPITAPICATFFAELTRSRRSTRDNWRLSGSARFVEVPETLNPPVLALKVPLSIIDLVSSSM